MTKRRQRRSAEREREREKENSGEVLLALNGERVHVETSGGRSITCRGLSTQQRQRRVLAGDGTRAVSGSARRNEKGRARVARALAL